VNKVTVKAPRSVIWLTIALLLVDGVIAAIGPLWLYVVVAAAFVVAILAALFRWQRRIAPRVQAAHAPGTPRPWVEVEWPRWLRRLALGWVGALIAGCVLLGGLLVVAVILERFG
jgi:hypothetical protein